MGGPPRETRQAMAAEAQATEEQMKIAQQQQQASAEDRAQAKELEQPFIDQQKKLATGSPQDATAAIAPVLMQVSSGYTAARDNIIANIPPGPARDLALSRLEVQKDTAIGGARVTAVQSAPEKLASLATGSLLPVSLSEIGAALSGYGGATTSASAQAQAANEAKGSQLGFLGSLAGMAGKVAGSRKLLG